MASCVKHVLKSLERVIVREDATKKDQVQEFFLQERPGQSMVEWVNVFEKAGGDMKSEGLDVELKNMGWRLFETSLALERQERLLGAGKGEYDFGGTRSALIKHVPNSIICQG